MAINWHLEPWRKLYTRLTGEWLRLSVSARGLADELIRYARDDGSVVNFGDDDPADTIAYMLSAKPHEHDRIRDDFSALVTDGYLVIDGTTVKIRNFYTAQIKRSPAALRQARKRERDSHGDSHGDNNGDNSRETKRNETKREEKDPAFDRVWSLYPRKANKGGAVKACRKLKLDEWQALEAGVQAFATEARRKGTAEEYIPHLSTFVNQRRWEDYASPRSSAPELPLCPPSSERRMTALERAQAADRAAGLDK